MKQSIFLITLLFSSLGFAQNTFRVSCVLQDSLQENSIQFEGILSASDLKPVMLASQNATDTKVSATYHDSAAAGPFDMILFNIIKSRKSQTISLGVVADVGFVNLTEIENNQSSTLSGCEFHKL